LPPLQWKIYFLNLPLSYKKDQARYTPFIMVVIRERPSKIYPLYNGSHKYICKPYPLYNGQDWCTSKIYPFTMEDLFSKSSTFIQERYTPLQSSERKWTSKFWTKSAYTDIFVRATTTYTSKQDIPPLQSSERKWTSVEQNIPPLHWSLYFQVRYTPFTMVESQIHMQALPPLQWSSLVYIEMIWSEGWLWIKCLYSYSVDGIMVMLLTSFREIWKLSIAR